MNFDNLLRKLGDHAPFARRKAEALAPPLLQDAVRTPDGLFRFKTQLCQGSDYEVRDLESGRIWIRYLPDYDRIRVTYLPVNEVPADVVQATIELVAAWLQPSLSNLGGLAGVQSFQLPDLSVTYARGTVGQAMPANVVDLLEPYRDVVTA